MAATRPALSRWRADRLFFTGAALFAAVIVFAGFARSYYLSHWLTPPARTPEITPLLHMHALVFTLWTCLIVVQPLLIAKGAIGIHRRLGIAGAGLAVQVWLFGNLAAAEALQAGSDRKSVVYGKRVSVRVELGGRPILKKKT